MAEDKEDEVEKRKKKLEEEQKKLDAEQLAAAKKAKGSGDPAGTPEHPDDKITRAEAVAERMEEANKVAAQQIEELRTLRVNEALSGESEAGAPPPEKKEETPEEYKNRIMAGEEVGKEPQAP